MERSRLRQPRIDGLEKFGLPSKGDKRHVESLLNHGLQEEFHQDIVERYKKFQHDVSERLELNIEDQLDALSIQDKARGQSKKNSVQEASAEAEQSRLLMAMRKLREGIVASQRRDPFTLDVYRFCVRAAILARHPESYGPALLHLLRNLHPRIPLSQTELDEFVGYLILDLVCRQNKPAEAILIRKQYRLEEEKYLTNAVLHAILHGNFHLFWILKEDATEYQSRLMEYAEDGMRRLAIRCLERAYFTVDEDFLVHVTGIQWDLLRTRYGVSWTREGQRIITRERKRK
ncbi:MAG: Acetolactate synthase, mitochondrial [Watsoniomyces obsoletus]|nr:MAG: Acetolactate synthase, mitochondrial [Watsoniomyces obsoletus]